MFVIDAFPQRFAVVLEPSSVIPSVRWGRGSNDFDYKLAFGYACFHIRQGLVGVQKRKNTVDDRTNHTRIDERCKLAQLISVVDISACQKTQNSMVRIYCPISPAKLNNRRNGLSIGVTANKQLSVMVT
jgi:hypothetical protein